MSTNPDIVWHRVEDGLPELPTEYAVFECLVFVPDEEHGGWVVSCDFWNRYGDDNEGPAFYRVEADKWDRQSQERVENATHWAKVEWPRGEKMRRDELGIIFADDESGGWCVFDCVRSKTLFGPASWWECDEWCERNAERSP